jgi:hypothetical protein
MRLTDARRIIGNVKYKDWSFRFEPHPDASRFFLQVQFFAPSSKTGEMELQSGRKWDVSEHMTESELVQTALKAVLTAEEHEAREQFTYKSHAIFGPHIDVSALLAISNQLDKRAVKDDYAIRGELSERD